MKFTKSTQLSLQLLGFSLVFLLSATNLKSEYLFGWANHNWAFPLVLCLIALLLTIINKQLISAFMSIGIIAGLFMGNYLGSFLRALNIAKITQGMSNQEIAKLQQNQGFFIWLVTLIGFILVGVITERIVWNRK